VAHPQIAVFARLANGQVAPMRSIEGQTTRLSRTMHGIAYDSVADRIIVPAQFSQSILSFRGDATGEEPPVRHIQGPRTQIRRADRVAVDPFRKEIFVSDGGQILVFPVDADGDVAPIRALRGPETLIAEGGGGGPVAVDPVTGTLVVSTRRRLLMFDVTADGNVKPKRIIDGPDTAGGMFVAAHNGLVFSRTSTNAIGVWTVNDNGAVPPRFKIGQGVNVETRGLTLDPKNQSVIATDKDLNAVLTWHVPEVFALAPTVRTN
jgi:hypothetical protein